MVKEVFVFGSNKAGRHGKGAALTALKEHGASYGNGFAAQGNAYAIPTKGRNLEVLPLDEIEYYIEDFIAFAEEHPQQNFNITKVGCGLAGYDWETQIRPLFPRTLPPNCRFI